MKDEGIKIRGMYRLNIVDEKNEIVGDSGWMQNQVTNLGFNQYLVSSLGSIAGSKYITHAAIGTGGAPAAGDVVLAGEVTDAANTRVSLTAATSSDSKTLRFTGTLASNIFTKTWDISNIGLINHSSTAQLNTIFAGNTYASSNLATNQAVNVTYDIIFS